MSKHSSKRSSPPTVLIPSRFATPLPKSILIVCTAGFVSIPRRLNLPQTVLQVQKGKLVPIYGPKRSVEQPLYPCPNGASARCNFSADSRQRRLAWRALCPDGLGSWCSFGACSISSISLTAPSSCWARTPVIICSRVWVSDPFAALPVAMVLLFCFRLCHPALRAQPGPSRSDVQHVADDLRTRSRDHLRRANRFQRGFPDREIRATGRQLQFFGATVPLARLLAFGISLALTFGLWLFLERTRISAERFAPLHRI